MQAAHAAARTKGTSLSAQYRRLSTRLGKKRAILAVAHAILVMAYDRIQRQEPYREAGGDFFDRLQPEDSARRLVQTAGASGLPCDPAESRNRPHALTTIVIFTSVAHAPRRTKRHENSRAIFNGVSNMTKTQCCIHHCGLKLTRSAHRHAADVPMLALTRGEPLPAGVRFRTCTTR